MMADQKNILEIIATSIFVLALIHTFLVKTFHHLAKKYPEGSVQENIFHLLGEVEVVFGLWAGLFLITLTSIQGSKAAIQYMESRNFTEPVFVFVILVICSTRPILVLAERVIGFVSAGLPFSRTLSYYITALTVGPLLGSLITEPAAMTVTALILFNRFYVPEVSLKLKYATIGLLFVNVSIGGTLTPFAAPPILMVASVWQWDFVHMLTQFGWKGTLACAVSTAIVAFRFRKEITSLPNGDQKNRIENIPLWVTCVHLLFLVFVIFTSHYTAVFMGAFLFFLGLVNVTREYQNELRLKEGMLVGFFLAGLVVIGGPQRWWLEPILSKLQALPLFIGSMGLTAITDNAALTYLGSLVPNLDESSKYALVAGSVVGGGQTVIANAPNPAGFGILNPAFGDEGISPLRLFLSALIPTSIAAVCFWFL